MKSYTFDGQPLLEDDSAYSAVPIFFNIVSNAIRRRGGQLEASSLLLDWVEGHHSFEDVHLEDVWLPIGTWYDPPSPFLSTHVFYARVLNYMFTETADEKVSNEVGRLFRENLQVSLQSPVLFPAAQMTSNVYKTFVHSARPLLLGSGVPQTEVERLEYNALKELADGCPERVQMRLFCVWARKREGADAGAS